MQEVKIPLYGMAIAIDKMMERHDNLYKIEQETNVSIETLEGLKTETIYADELNMEDALSLYYLALQWGHADEEMENKYNYLKKVNYGTMPLHFPLTGYAVIIYNDKDLVLEKIKEEKVPVKRYMYASQFEPDEAVIKKNCIRYLEETTENDGAFIVYKDGSTVNLKDYGLFMATGKKINEIDKTFKFFAGISNIPHTVILRILFTEQNIIYHFKTDSIKTIKNELMKQKNDSDYSEVKIC